MNDLKVDDLLVDTKELEAKQQSEHLQVCGYHGPESSLLPLPANLVVVTRPRPSVVWPGTWTGRLRRTRRTSEFRAGPGATFSTRYRFRNF